MPRYFLSPHRVARYYFHECDRYLRYAATPDARRQEEGVPPHDLDRSLVTKALLESRHAWEGEVLATHLAGRVRVADPPCPRGPAPRLLPLARGHDRGPEGCPPRRRRLPADPPPPPSFYAAYALDPDLVEFTPCRPDLIAVEEGPDGRWSATSRRPTT